MILHVVLYRPKPDLTADDREGLVASIQTAARAIPGVLRVRVGTQVANPPAYVQKGFPEFPFFACFEFEDRSALDSYLSHPLHSDLGQRFNQTLDAALIYDFEVQDVRSLDAGSG